MPVARRPLALSVMLVVGLPLAGCKTTPKPETGHAINQIDQRRAQARQAFLQGEQLRASGDLQGAQDAYRRATLLDGTLAEAWNNLGVLLLEQGTYLDASDAFRRALNYAAPEDPRPARNLGYTYAQAGWSEEALKHYQTALARSPNDLESLRGAIRVTKELNYADPEALDRVERAMMIDRDEEWRTIYFREQSRIQERLEAERRKAGRRSQAARADAPPGSPDQSVRSVQA